MSVERTQGGWVYNATDGRQYDYRPGYGMLATGRNYAHLDGKLSEGAENFSRVGRICQVAGVLLCISCGFAVGAMLTSKPAEDPSCDGTCIGLAVTSGVTGITSIALCCFKFCSRI